MCNSMCFQGRCAHCGNSGCEVYTKGQNGVRTNVIILVTSVLMNFIEVPFRNVGERLHRRAEMTQSQLHH